MPVATQNKITRSCGLSVVVGLSITYPSPAPWEGCDRRLTRRRREGDVLLSALQRQNNAEQNALVWTHLPWSADVSPMIRSRIIGATDDGGPTTISPAFESRAKSVSNSSNFAFNVNSY